MRLNDIHDFVYEGDEDYDPDALCPDTFEVRLDIELITGGTATLAVEARSKDDAVVALVQVVGSDVLTQVIENLENL